MVAAAVIGGAVIGAGASMASSSKAASAQTRASSNAIDFQRESRDLSLSYQAPSRQAGYAATAALMDLNGLDRSRPSSALQAANGASLGTDVPDLSSFSKYTLQTDPGYQFRLDQGNKAITNSLAARGGVLSGSGVKAALRYSQDYASNEYQNVYNRIATIAGFGANSTNASQNAVQQTSQQTSSALINAGEARASSYVAQGNAFANAGNQVSQYYGYQYNGGNPQYIRGTGLFDANGTYNGNLPGAGS